MKRKRSFWKIPVLMLLSIWLINALVTLLALIPSRAVYSEIVKLEPVSADSAFFKGTDNIWEIKKNSGNPFKILQISDAHLVCGIFTQGSDKKIVQAIGQAVESAKPDLIVLTGDILYPTFYLGSNNRAQAAAVAAIFNAFEIPWAFIYGNHDADVWGTAGKNYLSDFLEKQPSGLFEKGPENINGHGNYAVKLLNSDNSLNTVLFMLDTNSKSGFLYGSVKDSQTEWYSDTLLRINSGRSPVVPSMVFLHVPLAEYRKARDLYEQGSAEAEYLFGPNNQKSNPGEPSKLFETITGLQSTRAVFCGHDHLNNSTIKYKGVYLSYGLSIDYNSYASRRPEQRGAQLITVNADSSFKIEHLHQTNGFLPSPDCC